MTWQPHITVATIVEDQGRFLLVEEEADGRAVFNQPAGHLEANETLLEAALRETFEETGWEVELTAVTGMDGKINDVTISYPMDLTTQMLEYSGLRR